jgi:hypothetical protein
VHSYVSSSPVVPSNRAGLIHFSRTSQLPRLTPVIMLHPVLSADAEEVLDGEALDPGEAVALGAGAVDVEVLERTPVLQ